MSPLTAADCDGTQPPDFLEAPIEEWAKTAADPKELVGNILAQKVRGMIDNTPAAKMKALEKLAAAATQTMSKALQNETNMKQKHVWPSTREGKLGEEIEKALDSGSEIDPRSAAGQRFARIEGRIGH